MVWDYRYGQYHTLSKGYDMIWIWQVFGDIQEFTYIAEIFISNSGRITTICRSRISNEKVWIKVIHTPFYQRGILINRSGLWEQKSHSSYDKWLDKKLLQLFIDACTYYDHLTPALR
jgi:hypothetical protein